MRKIGRGEEMRWEGRGENEEQKKKRRKEEDKRRI